MWSLVIPLAIFLPLSSYQFVAVPEPIVNALESSIMFGVARVLWSSIIVWVVLEFANGNGGLARRFLSADIFQPFSRLSFAIYLIHIIVVWHYFFNVRVPLDLSGDSMVMLLHSKLSLQGNVFFCVSP